MRIPRTLARWSPLLALLFALPLAAQEEPAAGEPFLWRIEGETPSFLFGTIHIPDDRVLDLPQVVREAVARADALYCELDQDMPTQMEATRGLLLPEGQSLRGLLPPALYKRLESYLAKKGIPVMLFAQMKPIAVAAQVSLLDYLPQMQMGKQPQDGALYKQAQEAGKQVGALETVDEQIGAFDALDIAEQIAELKLTLEQVEAATAAGEKPAEALIQAYLSGDEARIVEVSREGMDPDDPVFQKLMQRLNTARNHTMAERIADKLKAAPQRSHFFAIGTLHFPSEEGILALLRAKGFSLTRLRRADAGAAAPAVAGPKR